MFGYANEDKSEPLLPREYMDLEHINFNFNAQTDKERIREVFRYESRQIYRGQKNGVIIIPTLSGRTKGDILKKYNEIVENKKAYLNREYRKSGIITMSALENKEKKKKSS